MPSPSKAILVDSVAADAAAGTVVAAAVEQLEKFPEGSRRWALAGPEAFAISAAHNDKLFPR